METSNCGLIKDLVSICFRFHITESTWQYVISVTNCTYENHTTPGPPSPENDTSHNNDTSLHFERMSRPIAACPLVFAVRSSGLSGMDSSSIRQDCTVVSRTLFDKNSADLFHLQKKNINFDFIYTSFLFPVKIQIIFVFQGLKRAKGPYYRDHIRAWMKRCEKYHFFK